MTWLAFSALPLLVLSAPAHAADPATITGHAHVIDGDTLAIGKVHVRLKGISAPELSERGGRESRDALLEHYLGQAAV